MKLMIRFFTDYKILMLGGFAILTFLFFSITIQAQSSSFCRAICALTWSPGEQNLLAVVNQYGLWLYDADDPSREAHLFPHQNAESLSFDPTGMTIAVTSCPETGRNNCMGLLSLFSLETEEWETLAQYEYPIYNVKFSPNGQYIAFGTTDYGAGERTVDLIDLATHKTISITETNYTIYMMDYSFDPQSSRIAIASGTPDLSPHAFNGISVWRLADQTLVAETPFGILAPTLSFTSDGTEILFAAFDTTTSIWDVESGEITAYRQFTEAENDNLNVLHFSDDSRYLIAALLDNGSLHDRRLYAWEVASGEEVFSLDPTTRRFLDSIAINRAGSHFAFGDGTDEEMRVEVLEQSSNESYQLSLLP